ncbi:MAG: LamG domain-containing protein [Candidatus Eisenbacteria bacterium]|nr:LamG domain-containing protein [Candidatus Eisenbacteria bacterium]
MTKRTVRAISSVLLVWFLLTGGLAQAGTWVYLRFEEGAGTVALDSSGNARNGGFFEDRGPTYVSGECFTPVNCIPRTNEPNQYALFFDGVDRNAVEVSGEVGSGPTTGLTIEFWVLYYSVTGRTVLGKQYGDGPANTFQIELNTDMNRAITSFNIKLQGHNPIKLRGPATPRGRWTHVAATWSAATTLMKIYHDGVLVDSLSVPGGAALEDDTNPFLIGAENDSTSGGGPRANWFNGYLDEVRVSDVALEPNQFLNWPPPGSAAVEADGATFAPIAPRVMFETPQPSSGAEPVRFAIETTAPLAELFIVNVGGRVIHRWSPEDLSSQGFSWHPRSRKGRVAAGTYWLRARTTEGASSATKMVLVGR